MSTKPKTTSLSPVKYRGYVRGVKWVGKWTADPSCEGGQRYDADPVTLRINVFSDAESWRSKSRRTAMFDKVRLHLCDNGYHLHDTEAYHSVCKMAAADLIHLATELQHDDVDKKSMIVKIGTLGAVLDTVTRDHEYREFTNIQNMPDVIPNGDTPFEIDNNMKFIEKQLPLDDPDHTPNDQNINIVFRAGVESTSTNRSKKKSVKKH